VDISDADIVFVNATCFIGHNWDNLRAKFHSVKSGARFILTSKHLEEPEYSSLFTDQMPMSWGDCTMSVFLKTK
jgi:hypothetical protein